MKLYILDDNGLVVFEFENRDGDYHVKPNSELQRYIIRLVRSALNYLANYLIIHRDD